MPELPEVETTRAGIEPYVCGAKVQVLKLYRRDLRWPISSQLPAVATGQKVDSVKRRGKYLIIELQTGAMLAHLGMSGSMRIVRLDEPLRKHDHWDLIMQSGHVLRFNDPRRFGALFWYQGDWHQHSLICHLGPEPLSLEFDANYLYQSSRGRKVAIKNHIMNSKTVVGVGNIYAAESLFHAGVYPALPAGKLSRLKSERLVTEIKNVLAAAIESGGTTLRDYVNGDGQPGYFQQELWVYGRNRQPCKRCKTELRGTKIGQRATVFCPSCQKP